MNAQKGIWIFNLKLNLITEVLESNSQTFQTNVRPLPKPT